MDEVGKDMLDIEIAKIELAAKTVDIEDIANIETIKSNRKTALEKVYTYHSTGRPKVHVKQPPVVFDTIKPKPKNARKRMATRNPEHFILVVGGTDGSGTRRAVQLLAELGVPMVVEDSTTLDIHADILKDGWPGIVSPFLKYSGSIEADPSYYPDDVKEATIKKLQGVIDKAVGDAGYWKDKIDAGVLSMPPKLQASRVYFGIKAPIIMTTLPFLHKIVPRLMYLQVVRDGRDIAFSSNTSPVRRFYELCTVMTKDRIWRHKNGYGVIGMHDLLCGLKSHQSYKEGLDQQDYAIDPMY